MVLKVVRGKILETLKLRLSPVACGPVLELAGRGDSVGLSKIMIILQITYAFRYYQK
jgi:hypothetical protein